MRTRVTLHCEQHAELTVDAPDGASDAELTQLALLELDASGGYEWETTFGTVELGWWDWVIVRGRHRRVERPET